jgi:hypothetical protein
MLDRANAPFGEGQAQILYTDADFTIQKPGRFVLCAVTGARIQLENLRYWSVARQEAYVDAAAAVQRFAATGTM